MNNSAKVDYIANGVTTVFSFPFWVMLEEDITVVIDDIIQVTGFTVNGILDPSGGNVEFDTPPANGAVITLLLTPVPIRLVTYQQNGDLAPITLNNDFDRLYLLALSNKNTVTQALSLGLSDIDGQGSFRARNNRITGLGAPIDNSDAVRKVDVVDLVKPFDDNARASADAAALSASASGASSADSALFAGKSEASAVRSEASAVRAKELADSIDTSIIEQQIEDLAYALTVHEEEPNPHDTAFHDLLRIPVDFPPSPHRHSWLSDITDYDPQDFGFVKVWENLASTATSFDLKGNLGEGEYRVRSAQSPSGYVAHTNHENNAVMAGASVIYLGNIFTTSAPNYIRTIYKKVKN